MYKCTCTATAHVHCGIKVFELTKLSIVFTLTQQERKTQTTHRFQSRATLRCCYSSLSVCAWRFPSQWHSNIANCVSLWRINFLFNLHPSNWCSLFHCSYKLTITLSLSTSRSFARLLIFSALCCSIQILFARSYSLRVYSAAARDETSSTTTTTAAAALVIMLMMIAIDEATSVHYHFSLSREKCGKFMFATLQKKKYKKDLTTTITKKVNKPTINCITTLKINI